MSKIEFSVEINPEKKKVALAAMALIAAIAEIDVSEVAVVNEGKPVTEPKNLEVVGAEEVKPEADKVEEKPKKKAAKKAAAKKAEPEIAEPETQEEETAEEVAPVKEEKAPAKAAKPAKTTETEVSVEVIRQLLKDLVRDHRDGIKAKLSELGASSASTLAEEHYGTFYTYLQDLKDE